MALFLSNPWELRATLEEVFSDMSLSDEIPFAEGLSVVYAGDVYAYCSVSGKKINRRSFTWKSRDYSLFELPGPAMEGDALIHEKIHAQDHAERIVGAFELTYALGQSSAPTVCFDAFLNAAYVLRRQILKSDRAIPRIVCWPRVLEEFCAHVDNDPARQAAIVDMAQELPRHLEKITKQPRRMLKRIRDQERIQRVREIDKACLIDLSRRPGLAIAEKAGSRQRILAVRREETCNTLENRVVRHCCSLIRRASERYLSFHAEEKYLLSKRKKSVEDFKRKSIKWNACDALRGVGDLSTPCKSPNYVLLQNPHYARIWKAYVALVKNEETRENIWRWQRQLWMQIATVGLSELFDHWIKLLDVPIKVSVAEDRVIGGAKNFSQAIFLNPDTLPGPYILGRSVKETGTLYLVDELGLSRLYPQSDILLMNADFYLILEDTKGRKIIPAYCRVPSENHPDGVCPSEEQEVIKSLAPFYPDLSGVLLFHPNLDGNTILEFSEFRTGLRVLKIGLSINPSEWLLKDALGMDSPVKWLIR